MSEDQDKKNIETGFQEEQVTHARLMNRDGSINVKQIHLGFLKRSNIYQALIRMSDIKFILVILLTYFFANVFFTTIYYAIGLEGIEIENQTTEWWDAFFFSTQTLTTLGYGHIHPIGFLVNIIASFEALIGFLSLSIVTGVIYGRFTTSKADLVFSDNILLSKTEDGHRLLALRIGNHANSKLSDMRARFIFSWIQRNKKGRKVRKYEMLPLQVEKINMLTTSWVIAHEISEDSPLNNHNLSKRKGAEFIVHVNAFDELYDQYVNAKTSYLMEDLIVGASFAPMTQYNEDSTIVDINKIHDYVKHDEKDDAELRFL